MSLPPSAFFSSRSTGLQPGTWLRGLLCWLLLVGAVVVPIPAQATLSDCSKTPKVIAPPLPAQVAFDEPIKLEIAAGLFCGNDPVNRHDPLGLADTEYESSRDPVPLDDDTLIQDTFDDADQPQPEVVES